MQYWTPLVLNAPFLSLSLSLSPQVNYKRQNSRWIDDEESEDSRAPKRHEHILSRMKHYQRSPARSLQCYGFQPGVAHHSDGSKENRQKATAGAEHHLGVNGFFTDIAQARLALYHGVLGLVMVLSLSCLRFQCWVLILIPGLQLSKQINVGVYRTTSVKQLRSCTLIVLRTVEKTHAKPTEVRCSC